MQLVQIFIAATIALGYMAGLAGAQIKIGAAEALTGNAAQYGTPIRKGLELALREINGSGGINGQKIELLVDEVELQRRRLLWQKPAYHTDRGYVSMYQRHVQQADKGADLDFLIGNSGSVVTRDSH